jgi:hypothetical protein
MPPSDPIATEISSEIGSHADNKTMNPNRRDVAQAASRRTLAAEGRFRIMGEKWHWDNFPPNSSLFSCKYHSNNAPYSFIHLPPTLYNRSSRQSR